MVQWAYNMIYDSDYLTYTVNQNKRDILFLTITLANLNRFKENNFYIILIVKKFYMRL